MSTSKNNSIIQSRDWSYGNGNEDFLFVDLTIALKLKLQWKGDLITQAILTLYNIDSNLDYKICGVTKCDADGEYNHPYFLIHLAEDGTNYKSEFTASPTQLGALNLPIGAEAHFLFKIHSNCPKTLNCGFENIKPLSKDGSIIICI